MKLNEIADYVEEKYPDSCFSKNHTNYLKGCEEDWYQNHLMNELMDFFSYEIMDMCGCGNPEYTYEVIRKILIIRSENPDYNETEKRYKDDLNLDSENTENHCGILQFILYMLDACGIVDHGSNIWCCHLTDLGNMYLTVLNAWHEKESEE